MNFWPQVAKGMRSRRLIGAGLGSCTGNDDEKVEDDTKRSNAKDNGCDSDIDLPQIARESTTEEQQSDLKHQRQRLHHMVEVPRDDPVEFPLSILAAFDGGSSHVSRRISVQPLLAKHREEGGEKCSGETGVEQGLDLDYCVRRACPLLREGGNIFSESGVVGLVDKNTKESNSLFTRIRLELRLDADDESRSDSGKQTSL